MKRLIGIFSVALSTVLMIYGILYLIEKIQEKRIGGRLVKVDYRFSREFN